MDYNNHKISKKLRRFVSMKKRNILSFAVLTLAGMHMINKFVQKNARNLYPYFHSKDSEYQWKYGNIFYTKQGKGSPVLLLHDLTAGSSSFEWHKLIKELEKNHTVYALDFIGCGQSEKPNMTYVNFVFVQMLCDFIHDIIKMPCTIITSGASSSVALMSTLYKKELFRELILINPCHVFGNKLPETENKYKHFFLRLPIIGTFCANKMNNINSYENLFYNNYFYDPYQVDNSLIYAYYAAYQYGETSKALYSSIVNHYTDTNVTRALMKLKIPVSIISSKEESDCQQIIEEYKKFHSNIKVETLSNSKHLPALEIPADLSCAISSILSE